MTTSSQLRRAVVALAVWVAWASAGGAEAQVPRRINLQGRLASSSGIAIDATHLMQLSLVAGASGGTPCHTEITMVAVKQGLFNVDLGASTGGIATACDFGASYWLEITVRNLDGVWDSPMTPRIPLTAVPYAVTAAALEAPPPAIGLVPTQTLRAGNNAGQIPLNNGVLNPGLNAEYIGGISIEQVDREVFECPQGSGRLQTGSGACFMEKRGVDECVPCSGFLGCGACSGVVEACDVTPGCVDRVSGGLVACERTQFACAGGQVRRSLRYCSCAPLTDTDGKARPYGLGRQFPDGGTE